GAGARVPRGAAWQRGAVDGGPPRRGSGEGGAGGGVAAALGDGGDGAGRAAGGVGPGGAGGGRGGGGGFRRGAPGRGPGRGQASELGAPVYRRIGFAPFTSYGRYCGAAVRRQAAFMWAAR